MDSASTSDSPTSRRPDHYLETIVSVREAARLAGVSTDTLRRYYRDKFIRLSPRRIGMRVRDALMLRKPP